MRVNRLNQQELLKIIQRILKEDPKNQKYQK